MPRSLPKQFLITHKKIETPSGWERLRLGRRYLYKSPELPVTRLLPTTRSTRPGPECLILGWFAYNGKFFPDPESGTLYSDTPWESIYPEMTGRFVILCSEGQSLQCITDPGALLPIVYRLDSDEAGSTPRALELTKPLVVSEARKAGFRRSDGTSWYPFGVTPFTGIDRVLPGTMLELPTGDTRPVAARSYGDLDRREIVAKIHNSARAFIDALSVHGTLECHLTAGWDSRMVLSACIRTQADIEYLTYATPGINGRIDSLVSKRIAQSQSLRHQEIMLLSPRQRDVDAWIWRTSDCVRDSVTNLTTTVEETSTGRYVLCGLAGEVGRAFYWGAKDIGRIGLSTADLLGRLGFAESSLANELAEQWLRPQAHKPTPAILDQAYIDLRLGGWAGPSLYGHPVSKPTLSPFNNAEIFNLMGALPDDYRRSGQFAKDFVSLGTPDLARIPVNRASGLARFRYLQRELAALIPKRARSSLRALLPR